MLLKGVGIVDICCSYWASDPPCQSMSYPSSLVSEHIVANAENLSVKTLSAWDFS